MYNIDLTNIKKKKKIYNIFLIIGILFLILFTSIFIISLVKSNKMDASVLSNRVEIKSYIDDEGNSMKTPIYYYKVKGKEYACDSNVSTSLDISTENKLVYYNSKNPSECVSEYTKSGNVIFLIFIIIPSIFILVGVLNIKKVNKRINIIKELNTKGKLIKNLPYKLEKTNVEVNNVAILRPVVDYRLSDGRMVRLYGDPRYDKNNGNGKIDLIIDENNIDNYFMDYEINRISGNLESDYYNGEQ